VTWLTHWLTATTPGQFALGVIGNLVAAALGYLLCLRRVWRSRIVPHLQAVTDLHRLHLPNLHQEPLVPLTPGSRIMYDSTTVGDDPVHTDMVAAYVDGRWPNVAAARRRFPHAKVVTITVSGYQAGRPVAANVIDCEKGDATPATAARWAKARIAAKAKPTIYCNRSTWPAVKQAVKAAGITGKVSYWIADYDGKAVIPAGAVAKQYEGSPGNRPGHYDVSIVGPYWPGVDPAPKMPELRRGSKGPAVLELKKLLHRQGYGGFKLSSDRFGLGLVRAVRKFKKAHRLTPVNGVAGPRVWRLLGK